MSKKFNLILICLFLGVLLPINAHSESADTYLELGVGVQDFGYKEFDDQDVLLDREDGLLPGLTMELGKSWTDISGALRLELFDGIVDYDGQTQSGIPLTTNTAERIMTFEALLRFNVESFANYDAAFIAGLGHREWKRDIHATNITSSLFEVYRWKYLTLGGAFTFLRHGRWSIGVDARWLRPMNSTMTVKLTGYDEATLKLKSHNSARVNLNFQYLTGAGQRWTISPYWELWDMGRSSDKRLTVGGVPSNAIVHEPRNETNNVGITVSVQLQ